MRASKIITQSFAWIIIAMLVIPTGLPAQEQGAQEQEAPVQDEKFKKEELAQMLAPIALYPDTLIAQILMASTYPLEVVEAERWMRQNKDLKGDALDKALLDKTWDPSVKSLCHFPDVLFAMSEKLDQTRKLGDAFLSQEDEVMATIQELRHKALDQGNLKTTEEQNVVVEQDVIGIEPANPEVVYVPLYNPLYVYGPWWYPDYPPYYWYWPPGFFITSGFISFGYPFFFSFGFFPWCWFDWHARDIHIDFDKAERFHRFDGRKRDFDKPSWRHDPQHRRGVAYRDRRTSERFAGKPSRRQAASPETRGFPGRRMERQDGGPSQGSVERREGTSRPRARTEQERIRQAPRQETPFRGIGDGRFERRAGERGRESRRSSEPRYQRGPTGRQSGGSPTRSFERGGQSVAPGGGRQSVAPGGGRQSVAPGGGRQSGAPGGGRQGGAPGGGRQGGGSRR